ncbi:MAG: chaperone NapD [Longimicrobiales bacterium]
MPICSYVVVPADGARGAVAASLASLPGCDVVPAENADLLLLVTETDDLDAEAALRTRIEAMPEVRGLVLTFGDVDPDTPEADPLSRTFRKAVSSLPDTP